MNFLKLVLKETIGLFIDDGALALLTIALIALVGVLVTLEGIDGLLGACILFLGCLLILAESVARAARRKFKG
ncbi:MULTISPECIES: hypothetical protein [Rhizobium]|uniref:Uncharacterized protein n=1 Tax=Rhizobium favelukesii TaxID=348824 RepID=W6REI9_9HYPH|nr:MULTISPECIES: hypothetical protein [Rhizobium]MCA0802777.1 hypothetical protein [Rhizobium sp. T1473]MCS0463264.1 hypothetical protein [Rhizobium favelukesii]UFS83652.1 hypothetical protein LPB79_15745 [Rhizobium sp. T136]CDM58730.1 hypothetical protein LPU83_3080 [Rhizobium favelukesii]